MCYSAMVIADFERYRREWDAEIDIKSFVELFWWKWAPDEIYRKSRPRVPRALEQQFVDPQTDDEWLIKQYIDGVNARQALEWHEEMFAQRSRLVKAERILATKPTKAAETDQRVATDKIKQRQTWLDNLNRTERRDSDSRFYPEWRVPLMVMEDGRRVVKPMRYKCRQTGKPADYDFKFPGTYNARRDNLERFWKGQFGFTHGIMIVNAFFENGPLHMAEHRELAEGEKAENLVLEFRPRPAQDMFIACLWSEWQGAQGEPSLRSFAAITDEPPPEVAAAGHDRCIMQIKSKHVDEWLTAGSTNRKRMYEILDDRALPYLRAQACGLTRPSEMLVRHWAPKA